MDCGYPHRYVGKTGRKDSRYSRERERETYRNLKDRTLYPHTGISVTRRFYAVVLVCEKKMMAVKDDKGSKWVVVRGRSSNFRHVIYSHNRDLTDTSNEQTTLQRREYRAKFIFIRIIVPPSERLRRRRHNVELSISRGSSIPGCANIMSKRFTINEFISRKEKLSYIRVSLD